MQIFETLDVMIGLSFIFLLFSLAVTSVNEAIAAFLNSRAKWLRVGIASLFGAQGATETIEAKRLADRFYEDPFIKALGDKGGFVGAVRPSYISAEHALKAIVGVAMKQAESAGRLVCDVLADAKLLDEEIRKLPDDTPIRAILLDFLDSGRAGVVEFEKKFEDWYRQFEGQVSSWYQRKTRLVLSLIAVVLAVGLNLDAIRITQHLWASPEARTALTAYAAQRSDALKNQPTTNEIKSDPQQLQRDMDQLAKLKLPMGWSDFAERQPGFMEWLAAILWALPGTLISAAAISLGAPFWYDTLKKLFNVRSVGLSFSEKLAARPQKKSDGST